MTLIEFENFQVHLLEKSLLSPLNLQVFKGDQILFTAPSGAGKTSFFEALVLQSKDTTGIAKIHGSTSYLPQSLDLIRSASALENVLSGALGSYKWYETFLGYPNIEIEKAKNFLTEFEIHDFSKKIFELSGGEQQRVALARMMMTTNDLILLDEPFSQLDDTSAIKYFKILKKWVNENQLTMICILHQKSLFSEFFPKQLKWDQKWLI